MSRRRHYSRRSNTYLIDIHDDTGKLIYQRGSVLGEGTYGIVYKAYQAESNETVVIKQLKSFNANAEGVQPTTLREASLLLHLKHDHIVTIKDVFFTLSKELCLVFEHCQGDLSQYIEKLSDSGRSMDKAMVKKWAYQMIDGVSYMHSRRVLHRDLKPQNILLTSGMNVKIGDLGLSKEHPLPITALTTEIVTLWYRPPELLLGTESYAGKVDVWSLGCIIAEMARGSPLFLAYSEWEMLVKIFELLGTPQCSADGTSCLASLKHFNVRLPKFKAKPLLDHLDCFKDDPIGCELIEMMLHLEPQDRQNAKYLLDHTWFDDVRNQKTTQLDEDGDDFKVGSMLDDSISSFLVDDPKWEEYFQLANSFGDMTTPESTKGIRTGRMPSTVKIVKYRDAHNLCDCGTTPGAVNDTIDLSLCEHCRGNQSNLLAFDLTPYFAEEDKANDQAFKSRRVLDDEHTENRKPVLLCHSVPPLEDFKGAVVSPETKRQTKRRVSDDGARKTIRLSEDKSRKVIQKLSQTVIGGKKRSRQEFEHMYQETSYSAIKPPMKKMKQ